MVRKGGLEPPRPRGHQLLRLACLPFHHSRRARVYRCLGGAPEPTRAAPDPTASLGRASLYSDASHPKLSDKESVTTDLQTRRRQHHRAGGRDRPAPSSRPPSTRASAISAAARACPGFRPGKVPRPLLERALGMRSQRPGRPEPDLRRGARAPLRADGPGRAPGVRTPTSCEIPAEPEWQRFEEGVGAAYSRARARPAAGHARRLRGLPLHAPGRRVTDEQVDQVVEQLRDQQATLVPVEDRGAEDGDFAVIGFVGRSATASRSRAPRPSACRSSSASERMVPGFEEQPRRACARTRSAPSRSPSPRTTARRSWPASRSSSRRRCGSCASGACPTLDDDFAAAVGPYDDLAALRADLRERMAAQRRSTARATRSPTASSSTRPPTRPSTLPDLLVDREVDVDARRAEGAPRPSRASDTRSTCASPSARRRPCAGVPRGRGAPGEGAARAGRGRRQRRRRRAGRGGRGRGRARSRGRIGESGRLSSYLDRSAGARTSARSCAAPRPWRCSSIAGSTAHPAFAAVQHVASARRAAVRAGSTRRWTMRRTRPTDVGARRLRSWRKRSPDDTQPITASRRPPPLPRPRAARPRCSCRWSSRPRAAASAPTTSTAAC